MAIVGILLVMSTSDAADQRAYASQTFWLGNIIVIVGAALFIRYSFGRYLRFWMIRLIHEQRAQTDRVVEALEHPHRHQLIDQLPDADGYFSNQS